MLAGHVNPDRVAQLNAICTSDYHLIQLHNAVGKRGDVRLLAAHNLQSDADRDACELLLVPRGIYLVDPEPP